MVMPRELERLPRHTINNIHQWPECLLLAQSGHHDPLNQCPLLGVKRTSIVGLAMSAFDPKRTLPSANHFQPAGLTRYDATPEG